MIDNKNRVPKDQWKKWSEPAKAMFNSLYNRSMDNREIFTHPMTSMKPVEWKTIAWNHAWVAADLLMGVDAVAERV